MAPKRAGFLIRSRDNCHAIYSENASARIITRTSRPYLRIARVTPDPIDVSAVAIKLDPLKIEFARRQPQMSPLMGLISVQPASGLPLTFGIFSFLS